MPILRLMNDLLREVFRCAISKRWWLAGLMMVFVGLALAIMPYEDAWLAKVVAPEGSTVWKWARFITWLGDFPRLPLFLGLGFIALGTLLKRERLRQVAVACLLGGLLAAMIVLPLRALLGRPRPNTGIADGIYGPSAKYEYQGCPSGHTGAAFGAATTLLVAYPPAGVPAMLGAGSVGWSRLAMHRHRPTDILLGAGIGIMTGLVSGLAARRVGRSLKPPGLEQKDGQDPPLA